MMKKPLIVLFSAVLFGTACGKGDPKSQQQAGQPSPTSAATPAANETLLPATKVRQLLSGNTIYVTKAGGGNSHKLFHTKNGGVQSLEGSARRGKWRVLDDGRYCLEWEGKAETCWSFSDNGKGGYTVVDQSRVPVWIVDKIDQGKS